MAASTAAATAETARGESAVGHGRRALDGRAGVDGAAGDAGGARREVGRGVERHCSTQTMLTPMAASTAAPTAETARGESAGSASGVRSTDAPTSTSTAAPAARGAQRASPLPSPSGGWDGGTARSFGGWRHGRRAWGCQGREDRATAATWRPQSGG